VLVAIAVWVMLAASILGILYAGLLGLFFFAAHLAFITHLRGNGVRLGPEQMPDLHARVVQLSERMGLKEPPEAYVVQAGGILNALATRFLRSNVIVLFSDLLDACGDNEAARDFIVAHELGHLHAGHLKWRWFILPGLVVPFLGTTWSRACEYTCDRYGMSFSDDPERALDGLCILAAGGRHGPHVNRRALVAQRGDLQTGLMRLGVWLSTHPPIADRLVALDRSLGPPISGRVAAARALAVIALIVAVPTVVGVGALRRMWPRIQQMVAESQAAATTPEPATEDPRRAHVERGILSLVEAAEQFRAQQGQPPASRPELYAYWSSLHPEEAEPVDPWTRGRYRYERDGEHYLIRSTGPDAALSDDDLYYSSALAAQQP